MATASSRELLGEPKEERRARGQSGEIGCGRAAVEQRCHVTSTPAPPDTTQVGGLQCSVSAGRSPRKRRETIS